MQMATLAKNIIDEKGSSIITNSMMLFPFSPSSNSDTTQKSRPKDSMHI